MILVGDCLESLRTLPDESVHSIVTDPPYGLSFMGKEWDHGVPGVPFWEAVLRVAKPGAFLLAFGGTRTFHRLTCAIEDAGWETRDCIMWVYGSGFPKSLDVSKAIDKMNGDERRVESSYQRSGRSGGIKGKHSLITKHITSAASAASAAWEGWGTALKPAWEPIIVARKPIRGTVAQNCQAHEAGALNIDGCRVPTGGESLDGGQTSGSHGKHEGWRRPWMENPDTNQAASVRAAERVVKAEQLGRWPANLIHDGSDEVTALFPADSGAQAPVTRRGGDKFRTAYGEFAGNEDEEGSTFQGDSGSAARFFYCAKASPEDRQAFNTHPTVKPTDLMRYLCRLVTRPGGTVLDPFMGSGSTGRGAIMEGFEFIGCEINPEYAEMARRRIASVTPGFAFEGGAA